MGVHFLMKNTVDGKFRFNRSYLSDDFQKLLKRLNRKLPYEWQAVHFEDEMSFTSKKGKALAKVPLFIDDRGQWVDPEHVIFRDAEMTEIERYYFRCIQLESRLQKDVLHSLNLYSLKDIKRTYKKLYDEWQKQRIHQKVVIGYS